MDKIARPLGDESKYLLEHKCKTVPKKQLHLPGPDFVDWVFIQSDRPNKVLGNLSWPFGTGRPARTVYLRNGAFKQDKDYH